MPNTLAHHLAGGYDRYQFQKGPWTREQFVQELEQSPDLLTAVKAKLSDLQAVKRAGRQCHISDVQYRIISDALDAMTTKP